MEFRVLEAILQRARSAGSVSRLRISRSNGGGRSSMVGGEAWEM